MGIGGLECFVVCMRLGFNPGPQHKTELGLFQIEVRKQNQRSKFRFSAKKIKSKAHHWPLMREIGTVL